MAGGSAMLLRSGDFDLPDHAVHEVRFSGCVGHEADEHVRTLGQSEVGHLGQPRAEYRKLSRCFVIGQTNRGRAVLRCRQGLLEVGQRLAGHQLAHDHVMPFLAAVDRFEDPADGDTDIYNMSFNIKCFIEGLYVGEGMMMPVIDPINHPEWCDTIVVDFYSLPLTNNPAYQLDGIVNIYGNVNFNITNFYCGEYYIAIKHRNSIETWSKEPVNFYDSSVSFDFTE